MYKGFNGILVDFLNLVWFQIARQVTLGHWLNGLMGNINYENDLFCLQARMSEVDTVLSVDESCESLFVLFV